MVMRWSCTREEAEYMRTRQAQNRSSCKSSAAENWMAEKLKATGKNWTRQAQWGYRLLDFWNHELGIAVEIDGPEHNAEYDAARDKYNFLRSALVVLRVRNFNEGDASLALATIAASQTWKERKAQIKPGKKLLAAHSLKPARSAKDKLPILWRAAN